MAMNSFWNRIFGKEESNASKSVAKERLRLVLVHDRLDISENVMNDLREELIGVIGKYMVIDEPQLDVSLTREEEGVALVANIPILNVRRQYTSDSIRVSSPKEDDEEADGTEEDAEDHEVQATEAKTTGGKKSAPIGKPETNVEAYIEA